MNLELEAILHQFLEYCLLVLVRLNSLDGHRVDIILIGRNPGRPIQDLSPGSTS